MGLGLRKSRSSEVNYQINIKTSEILLSSKLCYRQHLDHNDVKNVGFPIFRSNYENNMNRNIDPWERSKFPRHYVKKRNQNHH